MTRAPCARSRSATPRHWSGSCAAIPSSTSGSTADGRASQPNAEHSEQPDFITLAWGPNGQEKSQKPNHKSQTNFKHQIPIGASEAILRAWNLELVCDLQLVNWN